MKLSQILNKIDEQIQYLEKQVAEQAHIQEHGATGSNSHPGLFTHDKRAARDHKEAATKALELLRAFRKNIEEGDDEKAITSLHTALIEAVSNERNTRDNYDAISQPLEGDYAADDPIWSLRRDNIREDKVTSQATRLHTEFLQRLLADVITLSKQAAVSLAEPAAEASAATIQHR